MDELHPDQLTANRVYFTELDRITYSQVAWSSDDVSNIKRMLGRKLKLLALTKGHVVIAASHLLESELARELILPHPELLSERVIVPALRSDYVSCEAFLDAKKSSDSPGERDLYHGDQQHDMAQLVDSSALVVRWNPSETSGWFKNRLLADLKSDRSLVSARLKEKGLQAPSNLLAELESAATLSRGLVYKATQSCGDLALQEIVGGYADFLYYLSGAKAVDSEGVLPQENLMDFRLTDLDSKEFHLSEQEIFFKVFIDTVKATTSTHFPSDLLDALTIADAVKLHRVGIGSNFISQYNAIQRKTKEGLAIADPERLVLLMDELLVFEEDLHRGYAAALNAEMPNRLRQMRARTGAEFVHSLASLILLPYGTAVGSTDVVISGLRVLNRDALAGRIQSRIQDGLLFLERWIMKTIGLNKPVLLDFVDHMKAQYSRRMTELE